MPVDLFFVRDDFKGGCNIRWDFLRSAGLSVCKDPICFASGDCGVVGRSEEFIFSLSADSLDVGNPGEDDNVFAFVGWAEVFDFVRSHNPGCAYVCGFFGASGVICMGDRDKLDEFYVLYVVEMVIFINGCWWDGKAVVVDGGRGHVGAGG